MNSRALAMPLVCVPLALTACTSLTGLDGGSNYACKAPEGVTCDSVSGVYANAVGNNLPGQRRSPERLTVSRSGRVESAGRRRAITVGNAPTAAALRSAPRILRLWFKPWEDADHDLYDQGYVYVQVDSGQWQIDHVHRQIRAGYLPLKAPPRATTAAGDAPAAQGAVPGVLRPAGATPHAARPSNPPSDE